MMAQTSIASYFNTRKRAAVEELRTTRNKVFLAALESSLTNGDPSVEKSPCPVPCSVDGSDFQSHNDDLLQHTPKESEKSVTRSGRVIKRIGASESASTDLNKDEKKSEALQLSKPKPVCTFSKKAYLSPRKNIQLKKEAVEAPAPVVFASTESAANIERKLKTPNKKQDAVAPSRDQLKKLVRKELTFDDVKAKLSRSDKLQELKASLTRIRDLEKVRKQQEEANRELKKKQEGTPVKANAVNLKEFKTIELEVLTSPKKGLKTPTKLIAAAPDKHGLMSPKNSATPKKLLFSPTKDGSPSKLITPPAYQRFQSLAESGRSSLQMPYSYRCLMEMFKCLDTVCAMFYNRKEAITFKKLKPAVQRMLRKNLNESHLAQIKNLYPEAFNFSQVKMRNFGSTSKLDYYQLVITPNVGGSSNKTMIKIDEDNVLKSAQTCVMNPQVMIDRQQKFYNILLNKVKDEHDKFLKSFNPPIIIPKQNVTRWHPEFDLENCPEIEKAPMPQPPNLEKYSSAKDILSTARNLFNCSTPMERAMERLHEHEAANPQVKDAIQKALGILDDSKPENPATSILKNVPKSLLDKIRAKQAAKALETVTRRPSQDREAVKYNRLPKLALHLRNVFITEKKNVLPLEIVVKKIENSYQKSLTPREIETHLRLISKECPKWVAFHEVRQTIYVKIDRNADLKTITSKLEAVANEKSK